MSRLIQNLHSKWCVWLVVFVILGCLGQDQSTHRPEENRGFYLWTTRISWRAAIGKIVDDLRAHRLYVRFFDIVKDSRTSPAHPNAIVHIRDDGEDLQKYEIVPVVYMENRVFEGATAERVADLARHAVNLIQRLAAFHHLNVVEVQWDCDWTSSTREAFFSFLTQVRRWTTWPLSATLRLHQIKYRKQSGLPPVDRGMLMFYNMGRIEHSDQRLSIYNEADAVKYVSHLRSYPLPLDLALPLFGWRLQKRGGAVRRIIEHLSDDQLAQCGFFSMTERGRLVAEKSGLCEGFAFQAGDELQTEVVDDVLAAKAGALARRSFAPNRFGHIVLFELNERTLASYSRRQLDDIFLAPDHRTFF